MNLNLERLQQAVFRMQHDACFAAKVLAGDPVALASACLGPEEHAVLRVPPAAAYGADRGGKRQRQFLRNVSSEFQASVALGPSGEGGSEWVDGFPRSLEFHRAVAGSTPLPFAFRDYATRVGLEQGGDDFRALVCLEGDMAEARRSRVERNRPAIGEVVLAPWARLRDAPAGTHALASALQRGERPGRASDPATREVLLLVASEADPPPGGIRSLQVEVLVPLVAHFLREAELPHARSAWRGFAIRHSVAQEEVAAVAEELIAERVLWIGEGARVRPG